MNRPDVDQMEAAHLTPLLSGPRLSADHIAVALAHCITYIREVEALMAARQEIIESKIDAAIAASSTLAEQRG